jgi:hypothetical protein
MKNYIFDIYKIYDDDQKVKLIKIEKYILYSILFYNKKI